MRLLSAASLAAIAFAMPAFAQDATPAAQAPAQDAGDSDQEVVDDNADGLDDANQIVVIAGSIKGQVKTAQPPVATFDEEDVAALGAGSLAELLEAISPQTGSGRGRGDGAPVVLLNGQRVSGFRELRNLPPEAIRRVEVLPEEVALKFGFRADQRVVNFILKDNFRAVTVKAEAAFPGGGGFSDKELEASLAAIDGGSRLNITGTLQDTSPLTEAERGIVQPGTSAGLVPGDPAAADFRTLIADSKSAGLNATWAKGIGGGASLSLNGALTKADTRSLFGLDSGTLTGPDGTAYSRTTLADGPLTRTTRTLTAQAGATLNKPLGDWNLTATADYSHVRSDSTTDNRLSFAPLQALVTSGALAANGLLPADAFTAVPGDRARSVTDTAKSLVTVSGSPLLLPGGEASLTVKAGFDYAALASNDTRNPGIQTNLKRGNASAGFSLDLPITSRREDFGAAIGDLSLNLNADVDRLSDFGTLVGYGAGLTWSPTEKLSLQASYIASEAAPGLSDLGAPTIVTPGVSVYDFARGETVLVNVTSGGNPALVEERRRDLKFGLNWQLPFLKNSNFVAEYFRNRSSGTTNGFPLLTPAIEAAFPGRVVRDPSGRLISIDQRPVTFDEEKSSRLRYGFNIGGSFGKPDPSARRGPMAGMGGGRGAGGRGGGVRGPRPDGAGGRGQAAGGGRGGGMGPGGGGGDGRGRWNLAVYHTVQFQNTVQIAAGGPVLDLLDGDATSGGGVARHSLEVEGGAFYRGFGLRTNATYTGGTRIDGSGLPGSSQLNFAPIATVNLRLFADLGRMDSVTRAVPFLKGSRVSLRVNNVFDAQQRVTDVNGAVPLRYQPGYLDPRGRVFAVEFRKQF